MNDTMTDGEKLIWAAAFAKCLDNPAPPAHVVNDPTRYGQWELARTNAAIEYAGVVVERVRESAHTVEDGYGEDSSTYLLLKAMLS